MIYDTLPDGELIRLFKLGFSDLTPESQVSLASEISRRGISTEQIDHWVRSYYESFDANSICIQCGENLVLDTEELVAGKFVCPNCITDQQVDIQSVTLKDKKPKTPVERDSVSVLMLDLADDKIVGFKVIK